MQEKIKADIYSEKLCKQKSFFFQARKNVELSWHMEEQQQELEKDFCRQGKEAKTAAEQAKPRGREMKFQAEPTYSSGEFSLKNC